MIRSLSVEYAIKECCEALGVSRSGYYQWKKAEPTLRDREEAELVKQIRRVFAANKGRYGSPRVRQALRQDGIECGENRVARLMRENELAARGKKGFRPRTTVPGKGTAPNLIKDLEPSGVDQINGLSDKLNSCEPVVDLVNDHVAHTANPARNPNMSGSTCPWADLFKAQEAICRVAVSPKTVKRKRMGLLPQDQSIASLAPMCQN